MVKVAIPEALSGAVPKVVVPELNTMVPLGSTELSPESVATSVSCPPLAIEPEDTLSTFVDGCNWMVSVRVAELLAKFCASPAYATERVCCPTASDETVKEAAPEVPSTAVLSTVDPSIRETEPVGAAVLVPLLTAAVKTTLLAAGEGLALDARVVVVRCSTDCCTGFEVLVR